MSVTRIWKNVISIFMQLQGGRGYLTSSYANFKLQLPLPPFSFFAIDGWNWMEIKVKRESELRLYLSGYFLKYRLMKFSGIESKKGNLLARSSTRFIYLPAILAYSYAFWIFFAIALITLFYNYLDLSVPLHSKLLEGRGCIFIFYVAALLTITPKWNQPRYP